MSPTSEVPTAVLHNALTASITSGTFIDTAYYLFSKRFADGRVGSPRVLYGNSSVLKAVGEHFQARELPHFSDFCL